MPTPNPAQRQAAVNALAAKGATRPCVRCDSKDLNFATFTFLPSASTLQDSTPNVAAGAVVLACGNCGYLYLHSAAVLGLAQKI